MGRFVKHLAVIVGVLAVTATPAWAVFLDFGIIAPTTGTLSYAGGIAPFVGTNITVDNVVALGGASINDGVVRNLIGGDLDFTTGAYIGDGTNWIFGPGGSITITGGVDLNNDGDVLDAEDVPAGTILLSGTFTSPTTISTAGPSLRIIGSGGFNDIKDDELAAFYGLSGTGFGFGWQGGFGLGFLSTAASGSSFSSSIPTSGDLVNFPIVPEPSSMLLMGLGLIGGIGGSRRKLFRL